MITQYIFWLFIIFVIQRDVIAQSLDPYRRINDPLAIADLGGADSGVMTYAFLASEDSIQAEASGAGIIRSFWMVYDGGDDPDTDYMSLWVDDSLLFHGSTEEFFASQHGLIRPPYDSAGGGAEVCETQIPFHKGFVWTEVGIWHWSCAIWQPIDTTKTLLPYLGSSILAADQMAADTNYRNGDRFPNALNQNVSINIQPGDSAILEDIPGPAFLDRIHFQFLPADTSALANLWLKIYWDNSPEPSVSMPLAQCFGVTAGETDIHALFISVDTALGSYDLTFPMPFKVRARIVVMNQGVNPATVQGAISYEDTIWNNSWGYFATQYHVSTDIAYHLLHPVLHAKGRGRYIGAILSFPSPPTYPSYLEGDGYIAVDSAPYSFPGISTHYSGIEDYCDAGWYFSSPLDTVPSQLPFSLPFRGCPEWPYTVYRFHVNAPYNYTKSIDVDFGHGFYDDYTTTYSSASFYYQQWTPFYPSSDTIIAGNVWSITGAGFAPDTNIVAMLDSDTIYQGIAAQDGSISIKLDIPLTWPAGNHVLSINGIQKPEWICVLGAPKLLYVQDSALQTFSERDSIEIRAYGFNANEHLMLRLGDSLFKQYPTIIADSDGVVGLKTFLPWVPQGNYYLNVMRDNGAIVSSDSSLSVTRTLDYEFELLITPGGGGTYSYVPEEDWHFSEGAIAFCGGNWTRGSTFTFQFLVPFSDTFSTTVFGVIGNRYAIYRTFVDTSDMGLHDWFWNVPWGTITRDSTILPNVYLTAGLHTIQFVNEGWDDSAVEYSIAPDNFTLRPLSTYSGSEASVRADIASPEITLALSPNPVVGQSLSIWGVPDSIGTLSVIFYNEIGQSVLDAVLSQQGSIRTIDLPHIPSGSYWLSLPLPTGMKFMRFNILH